MYINYMNEIDFQRQALVFLERLFLQMSNQSIDLENHWDIDHLCFRVSSEEHYQSKKLDFSKFADLLTESEVNGRLISTFKLLKPVSFKKWMIHVVELPAPKKGKLTLEGFEHIEIVSDLTFDEIRTRYPKCKFDSSGLAKDFNQELEIELDGCALKFHSLSLESVVRLESNTSVYNALKNSKVLTILKKYSPLVAGTFPLGISNEKSDLDILIGANELGTIEEILKTNFQNTKDFRLEKLEVSKEPTLVCSFSNDNISFEIFVQKIPAVKQTAYSHFLVEEKLLSIGGNSFSQKIKNLRQSGLKTEPAFSTALNLTGNPYQELLNLQKIPIHHLQRFFI
jgi:predicted metalloenzyme YecM